MRVDDGTAGAADNDPPEVRSVAESDAGQWVRAFRVLFDPQPSHVALLRLDGVVLAVNTAWQRYATDNGVAERYQFVGSNYLAVCEAGVAVDHPGAREAYVGLLDVMRNGRPKFTLMYTCHCPARREWYRMWVEPQTPSVPAVIVAHQLIDAKPWTVDGPAAHPAVTKDQRPGVCDARGDFLGRPSERYAVRG